MPTLIYCIDCADARRLRQTHLQSHLDYILEIQDQVLVAGPNRSVGHPHSDIEGSCFIYQTDDLDTAMELYNNDPYTRHGVYETHYAHHFLPAAGIWVGSPIWVKKDK